MRGTIKFWNEQKGYGFIRRPGENDLFCHITAVYAPDAEVVPQMNEAVEYEITKSPDGRRIQACSVYLVQRDQ